MSSILYQTRVVPTVTLIITSPHILSSHMKNIWEKMKLNQYLTQELKKQLRKWNICYTMGLYHIALRQKQKRLPPAPHRPAPHRPEATVIKHRMRFFSDLQFYGSYFLCYKYPSYKSKFSKSS